MIPVGNNLSLKLLPRKMTPCIVYRVTDFTHVDVSDSEEKKVGEGLGGITQVC